MARTPRASIQERNEWADDLRTQLPPGSTAYTVLRHVSRSGMLREIDLLALDAGDPGDREPVAVRWLSYRAAALLGYTLGERDGIRVSGGGMDMGFHLVYSLSRTLYPQGFDCIGERCPSNDHSNGQRRPTIFDTDGYPIPHHADGGYAISHRWL